MAYSPQEQVIERLRAALQSLYDEFTQSWCYPPTCKHRSCLAKRDAFKQAERVILETRAN